MTSERRKRSNQDNTDEEKTTIKPKTIKMSVETMQESVEAIGQKVDKILERLDTSERNGDSVALPSFNSVISPGSLVKNTSSSGIISTGPRSFVLKHVFKDVSKFEENKWYYTEVEEHFGVPWCMTVGKTNGLLVLLVSCKKSQETGKWAIDTKFSLRMIRSNEKFGEDMECVFKNTSSNPRENRHGLGRDLLQWEEVEKGYLIDDKLSVEVHMKINSQFGVYKENLRSFDETMKNLSDVVLIVKDQKFYISKLFLATHSPYFNSLFLGQFKESKKSEIELTGIEPEDFQNYLEALYGHPSIDEITVEGILFVADMYDTSIVIGKCEKFLVNKSKKSSKKKFQMSIQYNLDNLKKKCLSEIKTVADIKSVIPGNVKDLEPSIMAELLEEAISLQ